MSQESESEEPEPLDESEELDEPELLDEPEESDESEPLDEPDSSELDELEPLELSPSLQLSLSLTSLGISAAIIVALVLADNVPIICVAVVVVPSVVAVGVIGERSQFEPGVTSGFPLEQKK